MNIPKKPTLLPQKPTLLQLRRQYNEKRESPITSKQLADLAAVRVSDEFLVELGRPVNVATATSVINAFNTLTGQHYTFHDIEVSIKKDDPEVPRHRGWLAL